MPLSYLKRRRNKLIKHNIRCLGMLVLLLKEKMEGKNLVGKQRFRM